MFLVKLARLLTALIPVKSARHRVRRQLMDRARNMRLAKTLPVVRARYASHVRSCREKLARRERLRVAFLICDASMFSGESVFRQMQNDPRFACSIVVAPRVTRGAEFLRNTLAKTVDSLRGRYGDVVHPLCAPDGSARQPIDADIVFSTVIYEDQTFPDYTVERLSKRMLVVLLYYGYGGLFVNNEYKTPFLPNIVFAWRYFVSNESTLLMNTTKNPMLKNSIVVAGYCKMDRLAQEIARAKSAPRASRRRVIIAPHHTIDKEADGLAISTFLIHSDFFLKLPELFPDVDFVFRPHPLLFPRLATAKWWGKAKTEAYRERMASFPNVEFQQGGDYFASFADSDAMIHDCASFLAEYFYTGKPQCYLLESRKTLDEQFLPFSRSLIEHVYTAFSEENVVAFIREVVVGGTDPQKSARDAFAAQNVCVNYPHATDAVISAVLSGLESPA